MASRNSSIYSLLAAILVFIGFFFSFISVSAPWLFGKRSQRIHLCFFLCSIPGSTMLPGLLSQSRDDRPAGYE